MFKVTIDESLAKTLANFLSAVQLCDSKGNVVGSFLPACVPLTPLQMFPDITRDGLERRRREGGFIPTEELLRRLADIE